MARDMPSMLTAAEVAAAAREVSIVDLIADPKLGDLMIERTNLRRWERAVGWRIAREGSEALGDDTWTIRLLDGTVQRWKNATCYGLPAWLVEQAREPPPPGDRRCRRGRHAS